MPVTLSLWTVFISEKRKDGDKKYMFLSKTVEFVPQNVCYWGLPGGPVVKNPLSNAENMSLIPDWKTKIPHTAGQLTLCTTTRERNPRATTTEKPTWGSQDPTHPNKYINVLKKNEVEVLLLLLLPSHFSRVRLSATP